MARAAKATTTTKPATQGRKPGRPAPVAAKTPAKVTKPTVAPKRATVAAAPALKLSKDELRLQVETLERAGIDVKSRLAISNRAHVIFPFHRIVEKMSEGRQDRVPIGTTSRGIGPCYEDKTGRRGVRIADLYERESFCAMYASLAEDKQLLAQTFNIQETIDYEKIRDQYLQFADRIRPMVCDTAQLLHDAMEAGKRVLFEGCGTDPPRAAVTNLDDEYGAKLTQPIWSLFTPVNGRLVRKDELVWPLRSICRKSRQAQKDRV